jgi:hypothetical protein
MPGTAIHKSMATLPRPHNEPPSKAGRAEGYAPQPPHRRRPRRIRTLRRMLLIIALLVGASLASIGLFERFTGSALSAVVFGDLLLVTIAAWLHDMCSLEQPRRR